MTSNDSYSSGDDDCTLGLDFDIVLAAELITTTAANLRARVRFSELNYGDLRAW